MKQSIIFLLFMLLSLALEAQNKSKGFSLHPIIGFRLHNDGGESVSPAGRRKLITSPVLGLEIAHGKFPLSISYQKDLSMVYWNYVPGFDDIWPVVGTWQEDQVQLYWAFEHFHIGLGHYWKKRESATNYFYPDAIFQQRGMQFSLVYPTHWVDIEFRSKMQYAPDFAALGLPMQSVLFLYKIGRKPDSKSGKHRNITVNGLVGARMFIPDIALLPGENFNMPFSAAPGLGLEFMFHKANLSLSFEKDWWLYLNGGSTTRTTRGLIFNSSLNLRYHHALKNERHLRFGLGWIWIEDNDSKLKLVTLTPTAEQQKLINFQVKGISLSISYEILPRTDVELRTVIPTIGERPFESTSRTSLGLFYRFNPYRNHE